MKKFIIHILLFSIPLIPLIILIITLYYVGYRTGELENINVHISKQHENDRCLIGLGYNEQTPYYKLICANNIQAETIALGTSRIMQLKKEYFKTGFYNCGGVVEGNYHEYMNFLKNLNYTPKIVFINIDSWVFNPEWNKNIKSYNEYEEITEIERSSSSIIKQIFNDFLDKKWNIFELNNYPENIGFNGLIKDSGFMSDGSYYYGDVYRHPEKQKDYQYKDTYSRIDNGVFRFEYGDHIYYDTVNQLEDLLIYAKNNGIYVIGFQAPFAPSVYKKMKESGHYQYISEISPVCQKIFKKYDFVYYDYIDISGLGLSDDYFVDGFHGSEVAYAVIVKDMIRKNKVMNNSVDIYKLEGMLENSYSEMVFQEPSK